MTDHVTPGNPYTPHDPAVGRNFVGRHDILSWIRTEFRSDTQRPLIVRGNNKMGKTSLLQHLSAGYFGSDMLPVYINLANWTGHGLTNFFYEITQTARQQLVTILPELPVPQQENFSVEPVQAFVNIFLQPALAQLNGRSLLFLFDNLHVLLSQIALGVLPDDTFELLHTTILAENNTAAIFTLNTSATAVTTAVLNTLESLPQQELTALEVADARELISRATHHTVVSDVVQYIHKLSNGHPHHLQQLASHLFTYQQRYGLHQLTIADVNTVAQQSGMTASAKTAYRLAPTPAQINKIKKARRTRISRQAIAVLGILVALFAAGTFIVQAMRPQAAEETAVIPTTVAAPLAVQSPVPQPTATTMATAVPTNTATPTTTPPPTVTPRPSATPTATATPNQFPPMRVRSTDGMNMMLVPAGTFFMGAQADDFTAGPDEKPRHAISLNTFYIDRYEVSVAQYAAFLTRLGNYRRACTQVDCVQPREVVGYTSYLLEQDLGDGALQYIPLAGFANYPINHVSWFGAKAYCEAMGARLPTEAEWEYAARGTDGRIYPWGNEAPNNTLAVFQSPDYNNMKPVDALPAGASPFDVYGMAGSVWEWVSDWYDEQYYANSPFFNPTGPETGLTRVIRGGAWPNNNQADRIRATNRSSLTPDFISATVGFRCALTP